MSLLPQFLYCLVFTVATEGIPLDGLALGVGVGACIPESQETVTIKKAVLSRLSPGHRIDKILKHTPSLSVKEAYLLVLELRP